MMVNTGIKTMRIVILEKNKFLLSQDINLIRVREHPLESLTENDIVVRINRSLEKKQI